MIDKKIGMNIIKSLSTFKCGDWWPFTEASQHHLAIIEVLFGTTIVIIIRCYWLPVGNGHIICNSKC